MCLTFFYHWEKYSTMTENIFKYWEKGNDTIFVFLFMLISSNYCYIFLVAFMHAVCTAVFMDGSFCL